jgi:hypothetical protein
MNRRRLLLRRLFVADSLRLAHGVELVGVVRRISGVVASVVVEVRVMVRPVPLPPAGVQMKRPRRLK